MESYILDHFSLLKYDYVNILGFQTLFQSIRKVNSKY